MGKVSLHSYWHKVCCTAIDLKVVVTQGKNLFDYR